MFIKKFGGSSLADINRINHVADYLLSCHKKNQKFLVVVSAMGNHTDSLTELAYQLHDSPPTREMDMLVSVGERISMALLSIALQKRGVIAKSFTGSQSGIITTQIHGAASIKEIKPIRIDETLLENIVPIIAGFQGVSETSKEITTLGRGGSDLSAVALAAHFNAECCEIFTDVLGVYSEDPNKNPDATLHPKLSWDELVRKSENGAKVMYSGAAKLAKTHQVPLHIRSSFHTETQGTVVQS